MGEVAIVRRKVADRQLQSLPDALPALLRRILAARGIGAAELDTRLGAMLPVSALDGTPAAAERFAAARRLQQRILVVGDFDADGATATALMVSCLRAFGFEHVDYLVPDRFRFGYGLSPALVAEAAVRNPDLIVTVDNGISSIDGVAAAAAEGIDVIVTDHHLPGDVLPAPAIIVNPNAPENTFASKALAGVGVAFYVMAATGQQLAAEGYVDAAAARAASAACLDLVALGTVADLVPMDHNNRVLVAQGLARIRAGHTRPGIAALFRTAGRDPGAAVPSDLGFGIAPRLNAAGRLEDIAVGIECLLAPSAKRASELAAQLDALNRERRDLQQKMQGEADLHIDAVLADIGRDGEVPAAVCLYDPGWHQGVVGLVATRIKERINRPVIAFAAGEEAGCLKGSGRSVDGVHIRDTLADVAARHPGLIDKFGGHAMAAGLTIRRDRLDAFRVAFAAASDRYRHLIKDANELLSDGELAADEFSLATAELLRHAAPWGQGFPEPVFDGRFRVIEQRIVGERHLKLTLAAAETGRRIAAIAFNHPELLSGNEATLYRAAFRLDVNEYRGRRSPQLVVEHIECV